MERKDITKILGDDVESDKISQLLDLFHEQNRKQKELYDSEKQRAIEAENKLRDATDKIAGLEHDAQIVDEKNKEIAGYLNEIADLKAQNQLTQIDSYETVKLMEAGAFDIDLCKKALDYDRKSVKSQDDYSLIDDAINAQIKNRSFLFKPNGAQSKPPDADSDADKEKKKRPYEPRTGSGDKKGTQTLGAQMAKELMNGTQFGIS